jgi:uncharacterized RDD family membrane protein YckC
VAEPSTEHDTGLPIGDPPSLLRRFCALVVDWVLCLAISRLFANPARDGWAAPAVLILEYGFFFGFFTQTPGMWCARIRCVDIHTGTRLGVPRALLRGLLLALFVPALIMGRDLRGLHDKAAGSVVIPAAPTTPA